jgi:hypothetical protein
VRTNPNDSDQLWIYPIQHGAWVKTLIQMREVSVWSNIQSPSCFMDNMDLKQKLYCLTDSSIGWRSMSGPFRRSMQPTKWIPLIWSWPRCWPIILIFALSSSQTRLASDSSWRNLCSICCYDYFNFSERWSYNKSQSPLLPGSFCLLSATHTEEDFENNFSSGSWFE